MTFDGEPGLLTEKEAFGETTIVVEPESIVDACRHLRDEHGFAFLADITPTDYLGWRETGVSSYIGTGDGRAIQEPMTQGLQALPEAKPKRFSVSYHLLAMREPPERLRVQIWVDDGEDVPSVIDVWPAADWFEREAWDMMGIPVSGHPNLARILMEDDWEGHPLRKDYPIGGEPVRFTGEE